MYYASFVAHSKSYVTSIMRKSCGKDRGEAHLKSQLSKLGFACVTSVVDAAQAKFNSQAFQLFFVKA